MVPEYCTVYLYFSQTYRSGKTRIKGPESLHNLAVLGCCKFSFTVLLFLVKFARHCFLFLLLLERKEKNENKKISSWAVCDWFSVAHRLWFRAVFTELLFCTFFFFLFSSSFYPDHYTGLAEITFIFSSCFRRRHLHCRGF